MNEKQFEQLIKTELKSVGAIVWKIHGHAFQVRGIPDLYVAHRKWSGWLELKVDSEALRPEQQRALVGLRDRRVNAHVLRLTSKDGSVWVDDVTVLFHLKSLTGQIVLEGLAYYEEE